MKGPKRYVEVVYRRNRRPEPTHLQEETFGATIEERAVARATRDKEVEEKSGVGVRDAVSRDPRRVR